MRILSLLPAATEIVAALDLDDALVGITHECDWPPSVACIERVTSSAIDARRDSGEIDAEVRAVSATGGALFALDERRITELAPDVILTQRLCEVCAVSETDVRALAARLASAPSVTTLGATSLDGVLDDIAHVADALGVADRGASIVAMLRARMLRVHETLRAARAPRPRVGVIEWTDPVFAAGHWVPAMVRRAGGVDVLARAGEHSVVVDAEAVRAAAPELLIIAPCGFAVERAAAEARSLLTRDEWAWARELPVWAVDGNAYVSRPGPRLVDGIERFARIMNPALFSAIALDGAHRVEL